MTSSLTIVTIGAAPEDSRATAAFERLTRIEIIAMPGVAPSVPEIRRAVSGTDSLWVLMLRPHERLTRELARAIEEVVMAADPVAWGYRIPLQTLYRKMPLANQSGGEIRLFHARHLRAKGVGIEAITIEGPVLRMAHPLEMHSFESAEEHRRDVATQGARSLPVQTVRFLREAVLRPSLFANRNRLVYTWIESARP